MPPSSLALTKLQRLFFAQLQKPSTLPQLSLSVMETPELPASARLGIYADMYLARLQEALLAEFPRLAQALGSDVFSAMAHSYLQRYPSAHPNLQQIGRQLPRFLKAELKAGRLSQFPFASDLALLEQRASHVFLAADDPRAPLRLEDLASVSAEEWPALKLWPTSTLHLVRLRHSFVPDQLPLAERSTMRLWRRDFEVFEAPMVPGEVRALQAARAGRPFGEVCLAAGNAERAATWLATWVAEGVLMKPDLHP